AVERMEAFLSRRTAAEVVVGTIGLVIGLGIAALSSLAVIRLPAGPYLLVPLFIICGYAFAYLAARKNVEILRLVGIDARHDDDPPVRVPRHVVDTSVIIDGRIVDIVETGFLAGELVVPEFVIGELHQVADSTDPEKRVRGRRGLDLVRKLMAVDDTVQIVETDYADLRGVDDKLVRLGQEIDADVLTTDFNLAKVAEIKGVRVLNINELANAVKTSVLPGEEIEVKVLREGREPEQGVGYLDDGTMIVVEDGRQMVGSTVKAQVTSVLQNPAGKMIFTKMVRR
ncbi:MAG TPA: TRAM domain-containing protein, partial [Thermoleophilia bacterium]|nr:TRAM domain-containing protein [Thermoleophilia bacterium]